MYITVIRVLNNKPPKMKIMKTYAYLLAACSTLFFASCVKDVDFDQLENVVLTPVFEADFIYSEFDTSDFIDSELPPDTAIVVEPIRDTINFDLIGTDFAIENLERIELTFEIRNTIETNFEFEFQFLNGAGQPIVTGTAYQINVAAGNGEGTEPVLTTQMFILDNATLVALSNSEQMASEIRVFNANTNLRGRIDVKSSATYFVSYES